MNLGRKSHPDSCHPFLSLIGIWGDGIYDTASGYYHEEGAMEEEADSTRCHSLGTLLYFLT